MNIWHNTLFSKALSSLKKLEYLNLGDCLLRSKGAVMVARSLANMENIKVIYLDLISSHQSKSLF